jgi:hypothetical protein
MLEALSLEPDYTINVMQTLLVKLYLNTPESKARESGYSR